MFSSSECFWAEEYQYTQQEWDDRKAKWNGYEYIRCLIPETGLYGYYCGQGDHRWAWVRKDIYDKGFK